jgi:serine/threonine protein kinase
VRKLSPNIDLNLTFLTDIPQTSAQNKLRVKNSTKCFAPIEQYERRAKRGAYTDVYALAATLYYLLTRQLPFPSPRLILILIKKE